MVEARNWMQHYGFFHFILFYFIFSFLLLCKRGLAIPRGQKNEEEDEKKKWKKSLR